MKTITVSNWSELIRIIENDHCFRSSVGPGNIQFRGQSNKDWKLDNSLKRLVEGDEISEKKVEYYEKQSQLQYLSQFHLLDEKINYSEKVDEVAFLIDMQHFSCPTRLLDWSISPYVAVYFAVNENFSNDGALFIWDAHSYLNAIGNKYPILKESTIRDYIDFKECDIVNVIFATRQNERIVNQRGAFSVSNNILKSQCDIINEIPNTNEESSLVKVIIPSNIKMEILARLSSMNISAKTLFPGMDGLGKSLKENMLIRKWLKA